MSDQREGLPSASGIARMAACPGSWALEQSVPREPETDKGDAAAGTRVHAALEAYVMRSSTKLGDALNPHERETFDRCITQFDELVLAWMNADLDKGVSKTKVEVREWLFNGNFEKVLSGQYDVLITEPGRALIIDWKTLFGDHPEAPTNLQLRSLAVLVYESEPDIREVAVAIIQPWARPHPTVCRYTTEDLRAASAEIMRYLTVAKEPDAPRIPGKAQCENCRARAICPEAQALVGTLAVYHERTPEVADLPRLLELCAFAKRVIDATEARAKRLLTEDPNAVPGWALDAGSSKRVITDPEQAFAALADTLTAQQFAKCCNVKISELEFLFWKSKGLLKKDAVAEFNQRLASVIEKKQSAPGLMRIKAV